MLACKSFFRVDLVLKSTIAHLKSKPFNSYQAHHTYYNPSSSKKMSGRKNIQGAVDQHKKRRTHNLAWRPVSTQANSIEECNAKDVIISQERSQVQEEKCVISSKNVKLAQSVNEMTSNIACSSSLEKDNEDEALEIESMLSSESQSLSIEVGASVIRFIVGKGGSTKEKIEDEFDVKIILPSSNKEDTIVLKGTSVDSLTKASEKIQAIIDEAVKSPNLNYSHFVSLPLAIHPELVDKLLKFQKSILGNDVSCLDESPESDSNEDTSDDESKHREPEKGQVEVQLKVKDDNRRVKVDITSIPLVSYSCKASKESSLSDQGIDKSIFIKPKTFHLTVLMLKLWNKDRVKRAAEVLQSISSKVVDALDKRPVSIRLKGLACMRGSFAKASVLYAPVEEVGSEERLLRACQVIIDAFVDAGLVLEKDAKQKLKLHATVMNARHRKRKNRSKRVDSFDARGIIEQFGSEEWGEYLIREAHLSQRFLYDENGYYHCCASIPFPNGVQAADHMT